jgi:ABC-type multidrug transport system fused ATPase/permease subunit
MGIQIFHRAWMAPLYVIAGMSYIFTLIGPATLVGFAFMCLSVPFSRKIAMLQRVAQKAKMGQTDKRVQLVSETLNAIKVVKLYAWDEAQASRLFEARAQELAALQKFKLYEALSGPVNVTIVRAKPVVKLMVWRQKYSCFW